MTNPENTHPKWKDSAVRNISTCSRQTTIAINMGEFKPSKPFVKTPLVKSTYLSKLAGCNVLLKLENNQPSGSFKTRGLGNVIYKNMPQSKSDPTPHFCSSSGGNAGLAAATAARDTGFPCTVVVPSSTKKMMRERIVAAGANLIIEGETWAEADRYLREKLIPALQANGDNAVYCHPFDNPLLWEGYEGIVNEIVEDLPDGCQPAAIAAAVGGGGLFAGISQGMKQKHDAKIWHNVKSISAETKGSSKLYQSLRAGSKITLSTFEGTLATSLCAPAVCDKAWELAQELGTTPFAVSDEEACDACVRFAEDHKFIVEPACGAVLATVYSGYVKQMNFKEDDILVIIVCGGTSINLELLTKFAAHY